MRKHLFCINKESKIDISDDAFCVISAKDDKDKDCIHIIDTAKIYYGYQELREDIGRKLGIKPEDIQFD